MPLGANGSFGRYMMLPGVVQLRHRAHSLPYGRERAAYFPVRRGNLTILNNSRSSQAFANSIAEPPPAAPVQPDPDDDADVC
jgi:hypothetical protein